MALASMIVGIAGMFLFFVIVPSIVACVLGLVAASQIKSSGGQQSGLGMARAGWILGAIGMVGAAATYTAVILTMDEEKGVFDLDVGDCVELEESDSPEPQRIDTVPVVDCGEPHTGEVVGAVELNPDRDRPYPSDAELFEEAYRACRGEFERYAGSTLEGSDLDLFPIVAEELAWRGQRGQTVCIAVDLDGADLEEPIGN